MASFADAGGGGVSYIVSFGRTGSGKSFLGNQCTAPGTFAEGDTLESVTTTISTSVAWNGDLFADVPGYFDTAGRDQIQQSNFVDFIRNKRIRCLILVFTDRLDQFMQLALNAFRDSELRGNIILVLNKDLSRTRPSDVGEHQGFPLLYLKAFQENFGVLRRHIESKNPVTVRQLLTPVSLFKSPLRITRTEDLIEFTGNEVVPEIVTLYTSRQVPYTVNKDAWDGPAWMGRKKHWQETHYQAVTDSRQETVQKVFKVVSVHKLTFAERFDGVEALYQKDFKRTDKLAL